MKSLSIKQPWADMILKKKKTIEVRNRIWVKKGQEIYIHVSKSNPDKGVPSYKYDKHHVGKVIGKATIKDIIEYKTKKQFLNDSKKHHVTDPRKIKKYWKKGETYGYILKSVVVLKKPFEQKGNVFFEVKK